MKRFKIDQELKTEGYGWVIIVDIFTNTRTTRDIYEVEVKDNGQRYLVYETELQ